MTTPEEVTHDPYLRSIYRHTDVGPAEQTDDKNKLFIPPYGTDDEDELLMPPYGTDDEDELFMPPYGTDEYLQPPLHETSSLIPAEIMRMDKNSIEIYKAALSEGKEAVHNIRVMIVGHYGVGKTTLTKRLFNEDVDISKRESTDGIEVHVRRCKVSLDNGQWNMINKDEETETVNRRLIKLLKTATSDDKRSENSETEIDQVSSDGDDTDIAAEYESETHADETSAGRENESEFPASNLTSINENYLFAEETIEMRETSAEYTSESEEERVLYHLKELVEGVQHLTMDNTDSNTADLSVWDFAGQYVFYATHQVFLSRRAVYLLVTDISKHVQDKVEDDECFIDSTGINHLKASEFVDFWLNSIHEFCYSPEEEGPPVLLLGTFTDKLNPETKDETVNEFFYQLRSLLINKVTRCHLIDEDFALDNSVVDINVERLKKQILNTASKQNYWGEEMPAKWITLESLFVSLKEGGLKVLSKDQVYELNSTLPVPIETEEELELFLRFHHESGNILYFSDENLHGNIMLDPQWLIDAFKSLITAKMFCCRKLDVFPKWLQFYHSAILTNDLIEAIWKKKDNVEFHESKNILLEYLEKLGFIAKPLQQSATKGVADYYFAPCVLKTSPPEDLLLRSDRENETSTSTLCFRTSSGFLPSVVFNKLLAACISQWRLSKRNGKPMIFCGFGMFDLRNNHTFHIHFFNHEIQIWLTYLSTKGQGPDRIICTEMRAFVLDLLENRFRMASGIEVFVKCPTADLRSRENAFALDSLDPDTDIVCNCRAEQHVLQSNELTKFWRLDCSPGLALDISRQLTEKDLSMISMAIGKNWELLGSDLGITRVQMERITEDNKTTVMKIYSVLLQWRLQNLQEATVGKLFDAMKNCGKVTIDWTVVERVFAGN